MLNSKGYVFNVVFATQNWGVCTDRFTSIELGASAMTGARRLAAIPAAAVTVSPSVRRTLEAFAVPESQRDAIAEGIEKVVLAVASSIANAKALDLVDQVFGCHGTQ